MRINNKPKSEKTIDREGIIYALIFVLYTIILILIFTYITNFIRYTINLVLSTPASTAMENKYGQLDLENYSLVAAKLGLKKSTQVKPIVIVTPVVAPIATSSNLQIASSSAVITNTSLPQIITEAATTTPPVIEQRPKITVVNSTTKSGLAANLKNKLVAAGYTVLNAGNTRPSLANTTIKLKNSVNPDSIYITEIKKIVSANYEFVLDILAETSSSDIEIIIGNK